MTTLPQTTSGPRIVEQPITGDIIPPTLINSYSAMTVPAYARAMEFFSENMASFSREVQRNGAPLPDGERHALTDLLGIRPNNYQNGIVLWRTFFFHVKHSANGYLRVERDKITGRPIGLHNLMPDDVIPFRLIPEGEDFPHQFYFIKSTGKAFAGADVAHLQGLSWDGHRGFDPVEQHETTLQTAASLALYQAKYTQRGTVIRGAVETDQQLTDPQMAAMKAYLHEKFFGLGATDDMIALAWGWKLKNTTISPRDSQLAEQIAHSTKAIAQVTGVDPVFLFERSESKYSGVEDAGENVVRYLFRFTINQLEAELTNKLLAPAERATGLAINVNAHDLLKGDVKTQTELVKMKVDSRLQTPNEGRKELGMPLSDDPEANKLKLLGDTSPTSTATPSRDDEDDSAAQSGSQTKGE